MRKIRLIAEAILLTATLATTSSFAAPAKNTEVKDANILISAEMPTHPILKSVNVIPVLQSEDTTNSLELNGLNTNNQVNKQIVKKSIDSSILVFDKTEGLDIENVTMNLFDSQKVVEVENLTETKKVAKVEAKKKNKKAKTDAKEDRDKTKNSDSETTKVVKEKETEKKIKIVEKKNKKGKKNSSKKSKYKSLGTFKITAYCSCYSCCGKTTGITASGTKAKAGRTIAADTSRFPFGTKMKFNGKTYTVEDRGGAIKGNKIDLYCNSHSEALRWGVRYMEVLVEK